MAGQLAAARVIAAVDLRRRVRNRSFVIQAIVGPIVLATIISLAFGSTGGFDATIGVVDADGTPVTEGFARGMAEAGAGGLRFERVGTPAEARARVEDGDLDAAVVVPAGFAASLTGGGDPRAVEAVSHTDRPVAAEVARSVASGFTSRVDAARLGAAATLAAGEPLPPADALAAIELPVEVEQRGTGGDVSPAAYFGPSMGLLFLFLAVGTVARELLAERRTRLVDRVRAAPVRDATLLAGKAVSVVAIGVVSLSVIWAVTAVGLGAEWGDPVGVVVLVTAVALAVAAISGVVAAVARTEQSADILAAVVAFVFALVGGNFIGPGELPDVLRRLSLLTPNGWALQGFAELSVGGGSAADVVPHAAVLLGWALVAGIVAAVLLPRRLGAGS
ncbi:MAG: ABC transporter permease [Acidimicrobiia bacterium]